MRRTVLLWLLLLAVPAAPAAAQVERVDLALVLAVDVSESVDAARFALQMEGIATALESREIQASVLSGPHQSMLIALVQWSTRPALSPATATRVGSTFSSTASGVPGKNVSS